jgi:hypothetical protein
MKIAPTIEGGLKIEPENAQDWHVLRAITLDAKGEEYDLASDLGDLITDEKLSEDWRDFVVPDLRESFSDDLHHVNAAIEAADAFSKEREAAIWITREDAENWYSALNQARLALEETYRFGDETDIEIESLTQLKREGLFRNHFYCALQSFILEHVMIF